MRGIKHNSATVTVATRETLLAEEYELHDKQWSLNIFPGHLTLISNLTLQYHKSIHTP